MDQLRNVCHVPMPSITMVRRVEGETIRPDGTRQQWIWYPTEDQYRRWLETLPR
jgi:hypothetical protein